MNKSTSPRTSSIYVLRDSLNNIRYVGITFHTLKRRLSEHLWLAAGGNHCARSQWMRSLDVPPTIELVEETTNRLRERYWIKFFRDAGCQLTNEKPGGEGGSHKPPTAEQRAKQSIAMRAYFAKLEKHPLVGKPQSDESRAKRSMLMKGRVVTEETRLKLSLKSTGRKHGPEIRVKIAARLKERFPDGRMGPNTGNRHTDETKLKISIAHKALVALHGVRPVTAETRAKLSAASKKQVHRSPSEETREKLRAAQAARREREKSQLGGIQNPYKGVPRSEETKAKMRDAWVLRRQK